MQLIASLADITALPVCAIVNAANDRLAAGSGVCGAIHAAAGRQLAQACAKIGRCPTGEARLTPGFNLPARYVIHAVGPRWLGGQRGEPAQLAGAYRASLTLARDAGCTTIAFPAISTGIYGYPLPAATDIAVATVRAFADEAGCLETVHFACFDHATLDAYRAAGVAVTA